jgi:chromosome segregation ATPase
MAECRPATIAYDACHAEAQETIADLTHDLAQAHRRVNDLDAALTQVADERDYWKAAASEALLERDHARRDLEVHTHNLIRKQNEIWRLTSELRDAREEREA